MKTNFSNWNKEANAILVLCTGLIASITAFAPQFLSVLHEAPFPVSETVDLWITWLLKIATVVLSFLSIFTKKNNNE